MKENRNLRSAIIFLLVGACLLGLVFFGIDYGVRNSAFEQTGKVNAIVSHAIDPSLIVFGSSVSEVGIDPALLEKSTGLNAFNCSINGTRFLQYKGLIDEFSGYSKSNKYVVLVETYFSFEPIDALTMSEYFLARIDNSNVYKSLHEIQPDLAWKCRSIPFYKFTTVSHRYYKNAVLGWRNILFHNSGNKFPNGYSPVDRNWEADADESIRLTPKFKIRIDPKIVNDYVATIHTLQKSGKTVILVLTPMFTEMLNKVTDIAPLRAEMQKISKETGATFIDFSKNEICNNKAYFYNSNHLNLQGSAVFSTALGDSLKSHLTNAPLTYSN